VSTPTTSDIPRLADKARKLLPILRRQARRPYIVEFSGTPKAGKTSVLHVINRFLKDCGYQVHVMGERAADCPVAMKGHFFFNTWTTTTMLASMIERLESEADVLLLDRGIFDALVWLEVQLRAHQVTPAEDEVFRRFVLLDRWRKLTDLTFVLNVSSGKALERENRDLLLSRSGTIMSARPLENYNQVLDHVQKREHQRFNFFKVDTTGHSSARESSIVVAEALVGCIAEWADPEVAALPREVVEGLFGDNRVLRIVDVMATVEAELVFRRRSQMGEDFVGLVGAVVLRHMGKMLLLHRAAAADEKREVFGSHVLWKGCHILGTPSEASGLQGYAANAIQNRLKEDFHLAQINAEDLAPKYLIWNRRDSRDAHHLGVFFDLEIQSPELADTLEKKVFKRERNRTKLGGDRFVSVSELQERVRGSELELESWSTELLAFITK